MCELGDGFGGCEPIFKISHCDGFLYQRSSVNIIAFNSSA